MNGEGTYALKILLATCYLRDWTGSELFTADLARSLLGRGHDVYVHSPLIGPLGRELAHEGINVADHLADLSDVDLEVAHVHHNVVALAVRMAFPALPMVMLLHGVLPDLEQPPSIDLGISRYLCVSEEVQEHAQSRGTFGAPAEVVRNFVKTGYAQPTTPVASKLRRVLVLSNDYPLRMRQTVETACTLAGAHVKHVGLPNRSSRDVRPDIARADLVVTLGRGALEAMAMNRNVVVMGSRGGDGFVDEDSFFEFRRRNFSGRTKRRDFTPDSLADELLRYDPALGPRLRDLVLIENGEDRVVGRLEAIYKETAGQKVSPVADIPISREISYLYQEVHTGGRRLREYEDGLAALRSSISWRSTAPLRRVKSLLSGEDQP